MARQNKYFFTSCILVTLSTTPAALSTTPAALKLSRQVPFTIKLLLNWDQKYADKNSNEYTALATDMKTLVNIVLLVINLTLLEQAYFKITLGSFSLFLSAFLTVWGCCVFKMFFSWYACFSFFLDSCLSSMCLCLLFKWIMNWSIYYHRCHSLVILYTYRLCPLIN